MQKTILLTLTVTIFSSLFTMPTTVNAKTQNIPSEAGEFNGNYYYVYDVLDSSLKGANAFSAAKSYCEEQGGYLSTITSAEENEFVFQYIKSQGYSDAYFGFTDEENEGEWKWVTGETVDYTNWSKNEPSSQNSSEDYAMFYHKYTTGMWNDGDFSGSGEKAFICEWDSNSSSHLYNVSPSSKINSSEASDLDKIKADISLWESAFYSYEDDIVSLAETARDSADEDDEIYAELVKTLQANIALDATFTDEEANAVYRAIYKTLVKETYNKGVELGKISVSGDFISDSTKIVNNIIENYIGDTLAYDYEKYRVTVHITGLWGANMGSIYVKQKNGSSSSKIAMFSTNSEKMAEIIEDYIDAMKQLANSELSTAIGGFIDYFSSTLGIDQFVKNKTIKALTKMKTTLSAKNLDTFVDFATDVQDIYKAASKVKSADSITSASTVYSAIETLSKKTDDWSASGKAATTAYSLYKKARNKLISDASCYITNTPIPEKDSVWTKFKKKIGIMCPVDVYVYDSEGNEIGSIVEGQVDCDSDIIGMDVKGDLKEIYVLDESEEITLKYEATDWGLLNLTFEEYTDDGEAMGRMNYYNIPMDKADEITVTNISAEPYNVEIETPTGDLGTYEFIDANDDGGVEITATAENGSVYGSATYVKGDFVQMTATADEGYRFAGWYSGDEFLERNALYEFTASEDVSLTAIFIEEVCYTTGDINNDGDTDEIDAALLLCYLSSLTSLTDSQLSVADCNGDSSIDMLDVTAILQSVTESEE